MTAKGRKAVAFLVLALLVLLAGARLLVSAALPDTFYLVEGEPFQIAALPGVSAHQQKPQAAAASARVGGDYQLDLRLFGLLPLKTVRAEVVQRRSVQVCGTPFGIKMFSSGVMVVGFSDILAESGYENPARATGLTLGDYLVTVNGVQVKTNEQMGQLVAESGGRPLELVYTHEGRQMTARLQPVREKTTGSWRAGMWVRDSSAGIGTLTFVDGARGVFAGLGHSITDADTGKSVTLGSGEIVPVNISGAIEGVPGLPGELRGSFTEAAAVGTIRLNGETGVYGILYDPQGVGSRVETAQQQEITPGPAKILTTVDGEGPKAYDVEIEQISFTTADPNRNLLLRVTDRRLLEATGGIVQGMSGSPILQNGRLVGAVTHVLVKDPTRGYGIFVENMLKVADAVG